MKKSKKQFGTYTASRFSRPPSRLAAKHSRRVLTMAQLWGEEVHPLHRLAERLGDKSRVWGGLIAAQCGERSAAGKGGGGWLSLLLMSFEWPGGGNSSTQASI